MRKLIARITGWPLVNFEFGHSEFYRFPTMLENGEWYVTIAGNRKQVFMGNSYHDFKPVMNCRKHGVPLFEESE